MLQSHRCAPRLLWLLGNRRKCNRLLDGIELNIQDAESSEGVPIVHLLLNPTMHDASRIISVLQNANPSIHLDPFYRDQNKILINPMCLRDGDPIIVAVAIRKALT